MSNQKVIVSCGLKKKRKTLFLSWRKDNRNLYEGPPQCNVCAITSDNVVLQKVIVCCVIFNTLVLPWRNEIRNIQCNVCAIASGDVVF